MRASVKAIGKNSDVYPTLEYRILEETGVPVGPFFDIIDHIEDVAARRPTPDTPILSDIKFGYCHKLAVHLLHS
jgi:hypothetical protein